MTSSFDRVTDLVSRVVPIPLGLAARAGIGASMVGVVVLIAGVLAVSIRQRIRRLDAIEP